MYVIAHSHYQFRMSLTFLSSTLLSELSTHTSFPFICFDYKMDGHLDGQLKKCPIALITCPSLIGLIASHHVQLDVFANGTRPVFSWAGVLFWSSWFLFLFIYLFHQSLAFSPPFALRLPYGHRTIYIFCCCYF